MNITLRDIQKSDYPTIEKIEKICFSSPRSAMAIKKRLEKNKNSYWIGACVSDSVVGYAAGFEEKGKMYLCFMAVLPANQKQGVGQALLDRQIAIAKLAGYKYAFLKTSSIFSGMLILAIKNGFSIIGFKANEWGDKPAIWLEKELG